jgi:hypothetical protein
LRFPGASFLLRTTARCLVALGCVTLGAVPAATGDPRSRAEVEVLRSDAHAIVVRARFAAPVERWSEGGSGRSRGRRDLYVPGLPRTRPTSGPSLPFRSVLMALPPDASYELRFESAGSRRLDGKPAPWTEISANDGLRLATDPPRDAPALPVEVALDGFLRDRRVVRLVFHPLRPDPRGRGSVFDGEITARLELTGGTDVWLGDDARSAGPTARETGGRRLLAAHDALYRATIVNESAIDGESYRETSARLRETNRASSGSGARPRGGPAAAAKLPVRDAGVWSVSHSDLLAAGVDASGAASTSISLLAGGAELPRRVLDGGDGTFDSGDRVEFYGVGVPFDVDYDANVYRVAFGESPGLDHATRDATPAGGAVPPAFLHTERFEINETLFTTAADDDGDYLSWARVVAPSSGSPPTTRDFPDTGAGEPADLIELPGLDPMAADVTVRARLYRLGGSSHTTNLQLNGADLLDVHAWTGNGFTHDVTTAASNLLPSNTVTLELSGPSFNQVLLNWIEIEYPRTYVAEDDELIFTSALAAPVAHQVTGFTGADIVVYDVTDPAAPVRLTGVQIGGGSGDYSVSFTDTLGGNRTFVARAGTALPGPLLADDPSDLQNPANGADLIVVAYREFLDELAPLVLARQDQGLRVALVDLEDVFDEFSFSRHDPQAIRDFVSAAYSTWQAPAPAYLLLVGNATLDPKQQLSGSVPPLMPSGTFLAPSLGLAATDNFFVTVAGADPLADLYVGRIPAQTEQEVQDAVARILAYEEIDPDLLNGAILLAADDDSADFETIQEDMDTLFISSTRIPVERAYLRLLGTGGTRQQILNTLNAGALMGSFLGHGNVHNWAAENVFVDSVDIPSLTNADRPVFLATMNCINGFHAGPREPNVSSLAEQVLLAPGGGAAAVWSPSALASLVDYEDMSTVLFRLLLVDRVQTLGAATTIAKIEAFTDLGTSSVNLEEMTLFGDPTLVLRVDGDRDGLTDGEEDGCACGLDARDADVDDDGRVDGDEPPPPADADADGLTDATDADSDDDGLPDGLEAGIDAPDPDTSVAAGFFRADQDPLSTTDPAVADTDGGGAADGAEDRNADGAVDVGETDPENPADDPACALSLGELANLQLEAVSGDVTLSWDETHSVDPCVLYRVLEADPGPGAAGGLPPFASAKVTPESTATLAGAASGPGVRWYLVVATRPDLGDGPSGH